MYETFERLLAEKGVTAYKCAQETGISQVVFSEWKRGKSKPKADKLKKLADYFGVPIEKFIE